MNSSDMSAPAMPGVPELDKLINQYVQLRDRKRALEAQHKAQLAPYNKVMAEVEGMMLDYMQRAGVDSVSTPGGTAYQSTKRSASIKDGAAFRKFVVETGAYNLVDWRANANAVFDYLNDHAGNPPPGVNPSSRVTVNFRRPNEQE
jgi:hypothetical protein